eukprot:g3768.t1
MLIISCLLLLLCVSSLYDGVPYEMTTITFQDTDHSNRNARELRVEDVHPDFLQFSFEAFGQPFKVKASRSKDLFSTEYREVKHYFDGSTEIVSEDRLASTAHCYYKGVSLELSGEKREGIAAVSTCGGLHAVILHPEGERFTVEPHPDNIYTTEDTLLAKSAMKPLKLPHIVYRHADYEKKFPRGHCAEKHLTEEEREISNFMSDSKESSPYHLRGDKGRSLQGSGVVPTKYVEFLVVNDNSYYSENAADTMQKSARIVNLVNALYEKGYNETNFSHVIQLTITAQHTFIDNDPYTYTLTNGEVNVDTLIARFHEWRVNNIQTGVISSHDNSHLFSGLDFEGGTVGYAAVSAMCHSTQSGGIDQVLKTTSEAQASEILAHELGHNWGMQHDSVGNNCVASGKVMEAVGGTGAITGWSTCSASYINNYISSGKATCTNNIPTSKWGDPVCGDGFIEGDEECDCGASGCSTGALADPCCVEATCKLKVGAKCSARYGCCTQQCEIAPASFLCRDRGGLHADDTECDVPEHCDGTNFKCPADVFMYPGTSCTDSQGISGKCYGGSCHTYSTQCTSRDGSYVLGSRCAKSCGRLTCAAASNPGGSCFVFTSDNTQVNVADGTPCTTSSGGDGQCMNTSCVSSEQLAGDPVCGNGVIEDGEACDCGGILCTGGQNSLSVDQCCNGATCQLHSFAECSLTAGCCEYNSTENVCTISASGKVCRAASNSCDAAETCNGKTGFCPSDLPTAPGGACVDSSNGTGACYQGTCKSGQADCQASTIKASGFNLFGCEAKDTTCSQKKIVCASQQGGQCIQQLSSNSSSFNIGYKDGVPCAENNAKLCIGFQCVNTPTEVSANCNSGSQFWDRKNSCVACHTECDQTKGCVGPAASDCNACKTASLWGMCVAKCPDGLSAPTVGALCQSHSCSTPCQNNGFCSGQNTCTCIDSDQFQFSGNNCSVQTSYSGCNCAATSAICMKDKSCLCASGTAGTRCEYSDATTCSGNGMVDSTGACTCKTGWSGDSCSEAVCSKDCKNGGLCSAPDVCTCGAGWSGTQCEMATCTKSCKNGSTCSAPNTCACVEGFSGEDCSVEDQHVCTEKCINGGACNSQDKCDCIADKWSGTTCAIPVCKQTCANGGTCSNPDTCTCTNEWQGNDCTTKLSKSSTVGSNDTSQESETGNGNGTVTGTDVGGGTTGSDSGTSVTDVLNDEDVSKLLDSISMIIMIAGCAAALVLACCLYCCCCRRSSKQKHENHRQRALEAKRRMNAANQQRYPSGPPIATARAYAVRSQYPQPGGRASYFASANRTGARTGVVDVY